MQGWEIQFLGISLGALPFICPELIKAKLEWQQLVENVKTVTTQGEQLWLKPTLKELGWAKDSPVMGTYVEPLDTYADMTHLISREIGRRITAPNNANGLNWNLVVDLENQEGEQRFYSQFWRVNITPYS